MEKNRDVTQEYHSLFLLYFIRFFGDAAFYGFFQLFVRSKNIQDTKIGILLSVAPVVLILMTPIWNKLAKNSNRNKAIITISVIFEGILIIIMSKMNSFEGIMLITILISFCGTQFYSLLDGFSGTFAAVNNKDYTPIRMFGSLGYIFGTILMGQVITYFGFDYSFYISGGFFILTSILLYKLKPVDLGLLNEEENKPNYKALFHNKRFYLYGIFYLLTFSLAFIGDNFFSLYLTSKADGYGLSSAQWGFVYSGMVVLEVISMLLITKFKINDYLLYSIAVLALGLRWLFVGFDLGLPLTIVFSEIRGIGIGIFLGIHIKHLTKILNINNLTVGILIIQLFHNTFLAVGNFLFPKFVELSSYPNVYLFLGIFLLMMSVIYIVYGIFDDRDYENFNVINKHRKKFKNLTNKNNI